MKIIRVKVERTVIQNADVLVRVPDFLTEDDPMYEEYLTDMAYGMAGLDGAWKLVDTQDHNWTVLADPFIEGQP